MSPESWKMIEELRDSHAWCCVKILSDYSYVWDVVLYYSGDEGHNPTIKSGSYEDVNRAVESAYKKAQEFLEKKEK